MEKALIALGVVSLIYMGCRGVYDWLFKRIDKVYQDGGKRDTVRASNGSGRNVQK